MKPARATSLERTVARVQWMAVAFVAIATVVVGGGMGALSSLRQDDATSRALARALVLELEDHASDTPERLSVEIRSELKEQATFGREIAIYQGDRLVGATDVGQLLGRDHGPPGTCRSEPIAGKTWRVCTGVASTGAQVFVAAPLDRLTSATEAIVIALLLAALGTSALFGLLSRRIVRRSLRPLDELRRGVSTLQATASTELAFTPRWGVTEVDSVAGAFDELLGRVRLAVERERRFVADASHELRTPLTRIRGQLELLAADPHAADARETLEAARRSCELLARTTESLLALAREEAALVETVDVSEIVLGLHDELSTRDGARDDATAARLVVDAKEEALVRGDPQLLRLLASNLIDNALKYSEGKVNVRVVAPPSDAARSAVELVVEDDGPGIPEGDAARLVQPFARGGSSRIRGTGLGLALVDHVARVHGGALVLGRGASGGLRATVTIPPWIAERRAPLGVR
ncbi:MAG: two-component sensor histidine kinase [Myxococcaceae bacterium]|nr:two-component sensor histidine kinase [Myxococcaceae bacterium]